MIFCASPEHSYGAPSPSPRPATMAFRPSRPSHLPSKWTTAHHVQQQPLTIGSGHSIFPIFIQAVRSIHPRDSNHRSALTQHHPSRWTTPPPSRASALSAHQQRSPAAPISLSVTTDDPTATIDPSRTQRPHTQRLCQRCPSAHRQPSILPSRANSNQPKPQISATLQTIKNHQWQTKIHPDGEGHRYIDRRHRELGTFGKGIKQERKAGTVLSSS
ncbi:hypothetical protein ACLOJK_024023 [Asimina triloba]